MTTSYEHTHENISKLEREEKLECSILINIDKKKRERERKKRTEEEKRKNQKSTGLFIVVERENAVGFCFSFDKKNARFPFVFC